MSKLYFLAPNVGVAKQIVDELHAAGVGDDDIAVLAHSEAVDDALPSADVTETSDVKPAMKQGAAVGGPWAAVEPIRQRAGRTASDCQRESIISRPTASSRSSRNCLRTWMCLARWAGSRRCIRCGWRRRR